MDSAAAKLHYTEAKRLFRAGQHAEALALLQALDAATPGLKHVLLAQAECLVALGDFGAARDICESILAREDDARARRILLRCTHGPPPVPPRNSAFDDVETPDLRPTRSYRAPLAAIAAVIACAGAFAYLAERDTTPDDGPRIRTAARADRAEAAPAPRKPPAEPLDPVAEHAKMLAGRKAKRDAAALEAESKRIAEKEVASKRPGYEIPPEEWNLDPETGVPAWRPGTYRQLPVKDSWFERWQGPHTLDVYIPLAYGDRPEDLFPTLSITMPHVNPGFLGLEPWAERRGVILIVLNTSNNDDHPGGNTEAQITAMDFLSGHLRAHPSLNFAAGTSGGARMAMRAAATWPDVFAGVLMMAHPGDELPLAPQLRVAFIYGRDDFNAPYFPKDAARLRANGHEVRVQVIPGGHITAPPSEEAKMLDWMLDAARRDLEGAAPVEQSEN